MKNILMLLTMITALGLTSYAQAKNQAHEESLDAIVATVNEEVITEIDFNQALETTKGQMQASNAPIPPEKTLEQQVLNQLIDRKLELQLAKQAGMSVNDDDLDQVITKIAKNNGIPVEMLYEKIREEGLSREAYRSELREQITMQKLQQQEVASRVSITPQELENFMRLKPWKNNTSAANKEYHLEDILIPLPDAPAAKMVSAAEKRAQEVMDKLRKGQAVTKLGRGLETNDLGWRPLPELPAIFAEVAKTMQTKGIYGPVQAPNGFHILKLVDMRSIGGGQEQELTKPQIEQLLFQRKMEEATKNWLSKLRGQAYIEINKDTKQG